MFNHGKMVGYGKPEDVLTPECISNVYGVDSFIVDNEYGRFIVPVKAR
jgi:iron complex transport system ATP-binding protein